MPRNEQTLELANFICRFGDKLVLLDLLEQVVLPAFRDPKLVRKYGFTSYKLIDVELVVLNKAVSTVGIVGRFVKDTFLTSEQVLDPEQGLIKRKESIRTSPSAMFLLLLDTHRLLYVKETSDAPSLDTFNTTIERFLRDKHREFIDKTQKERREARKVDATLPVLRKRELFIQYPFPELNVVPIPSHETLTAFIGRYNTLKVVEVQLLGTNHDLDNDEFFAEVRKKKDNVGSARTSIRHSNPKGLEKTETTNQLAGVVDQGNHLIKLDGKDTAGDRLRGNNEHFQVKTQIEALGREVKAAAKKMHDSFVTLVQNGTIRASDVSDDIKTRLSAFIAQQP